MRALRFVLAAALVSVCVVENSAAFAKGTGAAGGAAGGSSGGASGGDGGRWGGVAPVAFVGDNNPWRKVPPQRHRRQVEPARAFSSCFKQEPLFDRKSYAVVNLHGAECFGE